MANKMHMFKFRESTPQKSFEFPSENFKSFLYEDPLLVTGVLRAVVQGDLEKVKHSISIGKSPNINDNHGNTPLHVAVIRNLPEIVEYLLDKVNINNRNFYGETALFLAVKRGHLELVEALIKAKANVNLSTLEDVTPLHVAVKYPKIARLLIEAGAKINVTDYSGDTPLHEAVNEQSIEMVCMLLYYNADANVGCDNSITPFMKSIILESLEIQEILLDYVFDFNTVTNDGMTLLNLALTHTCPYVKEIIDRGADINYEHPDLNAFLMCMRVPDLEKFSLIWKGIKYQKLYCEVSYLELLMEHLDHQELYDYLRVIIDSGNLEPLFEIFDFHQLYIFLLWRVDNKLEWYSILSELICLYLCLGNTLNSAVIPQLYELYGHSSILQVCLHMDISLLPDSDDLSFARILYDTNLSVNEFKSLVVKGVPPPIGQFLPYMRIHGITTSSNSEKEQSECKQLNQIPSLLEFARNATRDYLISNFNLCSSKHYHLFVKHLPVYTIYKDILTFKTPLYVI